MTYDGGVGLLAMTFPGTLSADLTLHELSHLALGREGVAKSLVKVLMVCSFGSLVLSGNSFVAQ